MTIKKGNKVYRGEVLEALPNTMFKVKLETDKVVLTTLKGSIRRRYMRIFPGDSVDVEMTPYDEDRGRIIAKLGRKHES